MDREIRIRQVAEEIHREAKKAAIDSGVSLNAWIIEAIKQALPSKRKPTNKSE
jgi:predicted HicB family RNase H-like nuclease